jgi:hypothetical protein
MDQQCLHGLAVISTELAVASDSNFLEIIYHFMEVKQDF